MAKITIRESASDPEAPAAGSTTIFARADNSLQVRDESGAVRRLDGGGGGNVEDQSTAGAAGTVPTSNGAGGLAMEIPGATALAAHEAAGNPHAVYQLASQRAQANGYAALDGSSQLDGAQMPYGAAANTVCQGDDARLSDARAPTGAAAGDLSGDFAAPVVAQIQGRPVSATAPTVGQMLAWDGAAWSPAAPGTGPAGPAGRVGHTPTAFISVQDGPWDDPATWDHGAWVPHWGDTAEILHVVTIAGNEQVGNGIKDTDPGTRVDISLEVNGPNGELHLAAGSSLLLDGDVACDNVWQVNASATLTLTEDSEIQLYPGPNDIGGLTVRGAEGNRATITCSGQGAHFYAGGSNATFAGHCRVDMEHCNISNFGSDTHTTWIYINQVDRGANEPWRMVNVTCTNCTRIGPLAQRSEHGAATGVVQLIDFKHISPYIPAAPPPLWTTFETFNRPGMTYELTRVYFEGQVALYHCDDVVMTDFVFGNGFIRQTTIGNDAISGSLGQATNGVIAFEANTNGASRYGDSWEKVVWIHKLQTFHNTHYVNVGGDVGEALFDRCIFFDMYNQLAPNAEPDILIGANADSGTPATNRTRAFRCLALPNLNGYGNTNSTGGSIIVSLNGQTNATAQVDRCTVNSARLGAVHIGETIEAVTGTFEYMRNTLVLGIPGPQGRMMVELAGGSQIDTLIAAETRYNGGFNIEADVPSVGSGSGYDVFTYSGPDVIGANDIRADPQFVDSTRNPLTYVDGTLPGLIDQLTTDWDIEAMVDYVFAGWTPQNAVYQNAGDPADGSPDIGCADF